MPHQEKSEQTSTTRYVVLLVGYVDPQRRWADLSEADQLAEMETHEAFAAAMAEREGCQIVYGDALTSGAEATVLRPNPAQSNPAQTNPAQANPELTITEGPFAEATEMIGGLYAIDAPSFEVAVELLSLMHYYVMEIRPALDVSGP